ncbi:MAG: EamA family transporter [Proteobacteria bacterium]|nr:EamA family transporter [Pseudomonadota bacterium]
MATLKFGLWVGVIEMGIAFLLWSMALRRTAHLARIGQLIFLAPFLSLLLIERVLGETVPASSWVGLTVIVVGVALTGRPQSTAGSKKIA